jgi:hypothetical protein
MSDQQPFNELDGLQRILNTLRRRRQILLEQEAQQGFQTPPAVQMEIEQVSEQIRTQEAEIARVKTEAAVDQFSLAEAEYRQMVAFNWNPQRGEPNVQGETTLELARLQRGLSLERAREIEQEIRAKLAAEVLQEITMDEFASGMWERRDLILRTLGRAIRLDKDTAIRTIIARMPSKRLFNLGQFRNRLLRLNNVWPDTEDNVLFEGFSAQLASELTTLGRSINDHIPAETIDR